MKVLLGPQTQSTAFQSPGYSAGSVQPAQNLGARQMQETGQALGQAADVVNSLADEIQNRYDDARGTDLFNQFVSRADDIQLGYDQLNGKEAAMNRLKYTQDLDNTFKELEEQAENPMQKELFQRKAQVLKRSVNMRIQSRGFQELQRYELGEAESQMNNFTNLAAKSIESIGVKDGEFNLYSESALKTAQQIAKLQGYGPEQRKELEMKVNSKITSDATINLIKSQDYDRASEFLTKRNKKGQVDEATYQKLEEMVRTGKTQEQAISQARDIYSRLREDEQNLNAEGVPKREAINAELAKIKDEEVRKIARTSIKDMREEDKKIKEERYASDLQEAQRIAYSGIGAWRAIDPVLQSQIKPEDWRKLQKGLPRFDDPATVDTIYNDPNQMLPENLYKHRPNLTEATFRKFMEMGSAPDAEEQIRAVTIDSEQFNATLLRYDLYDKLRNDKKSIVRLRDEFQKLIDQEQQNKKRKLSLGESQELLDRLLIDKVYVENTFRDPNLPYSMLSAEDQAKAYVEIGDETVKFSEIPPDRMDQIKEALEFSGKPVTMNEIAKLWLRFRLRNPQNAK